jgi:hypothetical protein
MDHNKILNLSSGDQKETDTIENLGPGCQNKIDDSLIGK